MGNDIISEEKEELVLCINVSVKDLHHLLNENFRLNRQVNELQARMTQMALERQAKIK